MTPSLEGKYVTFHKNRKQNPKTWVYNVFTKGNSHGIINLGQVRWYAQWRQYAFYPIEGSVFEKTCLGDIQQFCILLNHKQRLRTLRGNSP